MSTAKCRRCHRYWAFNVNPDHFAVITKWCPVCIGKTLPVMGTAR